MKLRLRQFLDYDDTYSLKGIAMLMIIIGHAFNGYPGTDTGYFYPAWLDCLHMELWAAMGVSIFFFLSGYGMFLALHFSLSYLEWSPVSPLSQNSSWGVPVPIAIVC